MSRIRRAMRVPFDEPIHYTIRGRSFCDRARNISLSGIFIESQQPQPLAEEVQMQFCVPISGERPVLHVRGKVYRFEPRDGGPGPSGLGITFVGLDSPSRGVLLEFVQQRTLQSGLVPVHVHTLGAAEASGSGGDGGGAPPLHEELLPLLLLLSMLLGLLVYLVWTLL